MIDFSSPQFIDWLSSLAISVGGVLIGSGVLSMLSGRLFGVTPEHRLWTFIVSFALLCSLATAPVTSTESWTTVLYSYSLPLMIAFIYFLPTAAALSARNPAFQGIFILNLLFGWTLVGWLAAMVWALRPEPMPQRPSYRITPLGAVPDRGQDQPKANA